MPLRSVAPRIVPTTSQSHMLPPASWQQALTCHRPGCPAASMPRQLPLPLSHTVTCSPPPASCLLPRDIRPSFALALAAPAASAPGSAAMSTRGASVGRPCAHMDQRCVRERALHGTEGQWGDAAPLVKAEGRCIWERALRARTGLHQAGDAGGVGLGRARGE